MNAYAIPPLVGMLLIAGMGLRVFVKNPRSTPHVTFGLLAISEVVWLIGFGSMYASTDKAFALTMARIGFIGVSFIPATQFHFTISFIGLKGRCYTFFFLLAYGFGVAGVILSSSNLIYRGLWEAFWGHYPMAGMLYPIFPISFICYYTSGSILLFLAVMKEVDRGRKQQLIYVLIGNVCCMPALVDYIVKYQIEIYPFAYMCVFAWMACICVAMVKHHLLDIRVAITRTGILLGIYMVVLGVPYVMSVWCREWLMSTFADQWWVLPLGFSTVLATAGPFAYGHLRRQAEKVLLSQLQEKEAEVALAQRDALTGVLVRRTFMSRARDEIVKARESEQPCCVIMIDLDHFKSKNDTYGHLVGDHLLQETARRMMNAMRQPQDLIGRFGGEEFILLMPGSTREQALQVAQRIRADVASTPMAIDGHAISQTISLGIACFPDDADHLDQLIKQADTALYDAKRDGRDRVKLAS